MHHSAGLLLLLVAHQALLACAAHTDFVVLHTNDFHGWLQPDGQRGGAARLAWLAQQRRAAAEARGADVLFLDAGDMTLGAPPISQLVNGTSAIELYNLLGVAASAFGNHEFDKGTASLARRVNESAFTWLGANVVVRRSGDAWTHPAWARPYKVLTLTRSGVRVGVIGVTTEETMYITAPGSLDVDIVDPVEAVLRYYKEVAAKSDFVVLLAHVGLDDVDGDGITFLGLRTVAKRLAAAGVTIPLILGGHDHRLIEPSVVVSGSRITEALCHGQFLGEVSVKMSTSGKWGISTTAHTVDSTCQEDPQAAALVKKWADNIAPLVEIVIGTTSVSLVRSDTQDGTMGNLVCDSMKWFGDSWEGAGAIQACFMNAGGLRSDIRIEGGQSSRDIKWGDTYTVLPFENTLVVMSLNGSDISSVLERSAKLAKGLIVTAGLKYEWWNSGESYGARNIMIGGKPLDPSATYRIVTINFLAAGGDSFPEFASGTKVVDTQAMDHEVLNDYIGKGLGGTISNESIEMDRATRIDPPHAGHPAPRPLVLPKNWKPNRQ